MADSTTEIDLDSVIDRLLEGELAYLDFMIVIAQNAIGAERVKGSLTGRRGWSGVRCCSVGAPLRYKAC